MKIGNIKNYYGVLSVKQKDNKYFWCIEDVIKNHWQEIPKWLYLSLIAFNEKGMDAEPPKEVSE